jgi:hypothetical protein
MNIPDAEKGTKDAAASTLDFAQSHLTEAELAEAQKMARDWLQGIR